jgi:hypothetical protein
MCHFCRGGEYSNAIVGPLEPLSSKGSHLGYFSDLDGCHQLKAPPALWSNLLNSGDGGVPRCFWKTGHARVFWVLELLVALTYLAAALMLFVLQVIRSSAAAPLAQLLAMLEPALRSMCGLGSWQVGPPVILHVILSNYGGCQ